MMDRDDDWESFSGEMEKISVDTDRWDALLTHLLWVVPLLTAIAVVALVIWRI